MAALNFPVNPTNGDTFNGWTWNSTTGAWLASPVLPKTAVTQDTPPTSPQNGDLWYNTLDGTMYVYYVDIDTSQWVEVKANSSMGSTTTTRLDALEYAPVKLNKQTILSNFSIPSGYNGSSAGPITIPDGVTVSIADGSAWSIV